MATSFNYSVSGDTLNGAVAVDKLTNEIRAEDTITFALDSLTVSGDALDIVFRGNLSAGEETALDAVVAAHDGNPGVGDAERFKIVGEDQVTPADILDVSGVKRFAIDVGGVNTINPQIAARVFAPFSPWSASPGSGDYVPFESLLFESQLGMHDATLDVSSTATSGGASTLTDTSQTWSTDEWATAIVKITGGTGEGQWREIGSNTADTLTLNNAWDTNPDATSTYYISLNNSKLVAPIGGIYQIQCHYSIAYQSGISSPFLYVNGAFKGLNWQHAGQNVELNGFLSQPMELAKDDVVQMRVYNGDSVPHNMFGGEFRLWFAMYKV